MYTYIYIYLNAVNQPWYINDPYTAELRLLGNVNDFALCLNLHGAQLVIGLGELTFQLGQLRLGPYAQTFHGKQKISNFVSARVCQPCA